MKNTITISEVLIGNQFTNELGYKRQLVTLLTLERVPQFDKEGGEKRLIQPKLFKVEKSDFTRILALNPWLSIIRKRRLSEEEEALSEQEKMELVFERHIQLLHSAVLEIERDEDIRPIFTDEYIVDEEGNPVRDDNGDAMRKPALDSDNNPITELVGFEDTRFLKLTLSEPALELAKEFAKER